MKTRRLTAGCWRGILSLCAAFVALAAGVPAQAHEPWLQLSPSADGSLTVEAGFSDGGDMTGLAVTVLDRETGAVISGYTLPADGKLVVPIPPVAYRVLFDGGAGHKVSKIGPARPAAAAEKPAAGESPPAVKETSGGMPGAPVLLSVALVFLVAVMSFVFGYAAARTGKDAAR
ncbi:hypothetical protein OpiT1DRAFT_01364 [Opitutaceae bacterium TAV1]|nr:hypothetical protein OpiT1DRAFT_01364 [Opitutaceae bacterium TAV1]